MAGSKCESQCYTVPRFDPAPDVREPEGFLFDFSFSQKLSENIESFDRDFTNNDDNAHSDFIYILLIYNQQYTCIYLFLYSVSSWQVIKLQL